MKATQRFLWLIIVFSGSSFTYPLSALYVGWISFKSLVLPQSFPRLIAYDLIPFMFIMTWIYGLFLGYVLDNNLRFIFSNFAGMSLYVLYFIMLKYKINKIQLINTILNATLVSLLVNVFVSICLYAHFYEFVAEYLAPILGGFLGGDRGDGHFRMLNQSQVSIFMLLTALLWSNCSKKNVTDKYRLLLMSSLKKYVLLFLSLYVIVAMSLSKGSMLAVFVVFSVYFLIYNTLTNVFKYAVLLLIVFYILILFDYSNFIFSIFSPKEVSNIVRYDQLGKMINDLTFLGRGLGAVIKGFARSSEFPYGFELSYINMLHKFGIFAVPLFIVYGYSLLRAIFNLWRYKNSEEGCYYAVALGALCYLFPAIGNPVIFAPSFVIFHCISLYLMRPDRIASARRDTFAPDRLWPSQQPPYSVL